MSSYSEPGGVLVTEETCAAVRDRYHVERRDVIDVKGKGPMTTYVVRGPRPGAPSGRRDAMEEATPPVTCPRLHTTRRVRSALAPPVAGSTVSGAGGR